ncbi:acyclic terpene utilization AtuA family protein [Anatilimnocola sp. NA78]|uniref:acyclic terpene utilization AtuA family protein n=1 Tax=Anatilimnocola sp. NA78 TaxID=3415683 RepID=UPI003CE50DB1
MRIANGAGFLGDSITAPRRLVEGTSVDYLTIEHLAELTMSILARQREKDPRAGYAEDFVEVVGSLANALRMQTQLKVIANSGGINPLACAAAVAKVLAAEKLNDVPIAVVTGDDLLPHLDLILASGCELQNLETAEPLGTLGPRSRIVSANAYLGAQPIVEALAGGARIVITGRVADASLTVAPLVHEFGWQWNDLPRIAAATVAGHLIECGAQVTGGYSTEWQQYHLADVGYPIAEVNAAGETIITKPPGTGGKVTFRTVAEQLVYEIGDPQHYLTPDIDCDFTTVQLQDLGNDRVRVTGASGHVATDTYKVSLAYRDGFMASGQLLVYGLDCREKAQACGEMILSRVNAAGFSLSRTNIELIGQGAGVPGSWFWRKYQPPGELMLRVTVHDANRAAVEYFTREIAPLITSGPAGLAGYASGRPAVRPVFAYWPTLVPKSLVKSHVTVRTAQEWLA